MGSGQRWFNIWPMVRLSLCPGDCQPWLLVKSGWTSNSHPQTPVPSLGPPHGGSREGARCPSCPQPPHWNSSGDSRWGRAGAAGPALPFHPVPCWRPGFMGLPISSHSCRGALISALITPQSARTRPAPTVLWAFSPLRRGEKGSHRGCFRASAPQLPPVRPSRCPEGWRGVGRGHLWAVRASGGWRGNIPEPAFPCGERRQMATPEPNKAPHLPGLPARPWARPWDPPGPARPGAAQSLPPVTTSQHPPSARLQRCHLSSPDACSSPRSGWDKEGGAGRNQEDHP